MLLVQRTFTFYDMLLMKNSLRSAEEMLTDEKKTVADILAWCDYMERIEDARAQLYRSTHVYIKDVRDKICSQQIPAGDATINTTTVAAASTTSGSAPLTATSHRRRLKAGSTPNRLPLLPSTVVMMCPKMVPSECLSCLISLEMHPVTAVTM
ncbi:hypothetical protein FOZ60_015338 [Perkinsus olseni]|uniref:Uncharacterized protein n=1 Tax=Perkinsus olseni TaxID=32597 RepID=A0A7J6N5N7_PEROL|nr:hypothetical protein FOZ60_015338 [Perkinsus olseni]